MLAFVLVAGLAMQDPAAGIAEDAPLSARVSRIEACLSTTGKSDPSVCIGAVATPCVEARQDESTVTTNACMRNETEAWEALMARWLDEASANTEMAEAGRDHLKAGQAAWETARHDSIQAYQGRQGTVYQVIASYWWRDWTARRALWLYDLATGPLG
jgi:uncharacterized protein YecT (DUF1311 family)